MAATHEDRNAQLSPGVAIKAPCKAATVGAITLSGEQTVDGVALISGDRCLVKNQVDQTTNGIYGVSTGSWTREPDFDGTRDVVTGTFVFITNGATNAGAFYECTTTGTIVFGTSNITFAVGALGPIAIPIPATNVQFTQSGAGAVARTVQDKERDFVSVMDLGASASATAAVNTTAFNAAIAASLAVYVPPGTYQLNALATVTASLYLFGAGRASKLVFNTTGSAIVGAPSVAGQNVTFCVSNLAFGNVTNVPAAFIENNNFVNAVFEKLYFSDCAATYCIKNTEGYGTTIRECVFSDVTGGAILLRDNGAAPRYSYVFGIENCDITRPSGHGIEVETVTALKISKTVVEGCGGKGIVTSTNASGLSIEIMIDSCYFEQNTGADIDLGTDGTSYWGRAIISNSFFNVTPTIALGAKSKAIFIGIQGTGGSIATVSGSANAEAIFVGCEMGNFTQSGTFSWLVIGYQGQITASKDATVASNQSGGLLVKSASSLLKLLNIGFDVAADVGFIQAVFDGTVVKPLQLNPNGGAVNTGGKVYPATDGSAVQSVAGIYAGNGVPNNANGANGDFYFRGDGTQAGNTVIYHKQAGAWVALITT